ncbi:MAG: polyphosphate polymerase domain-containing protein [Ignavibacteria bacterium]|nr:polyphosphate polymerase domain-containing protein [Ignavibacteria bacterium]
MTAAYSHIKTIASFNTIQLNQMDKVNLMNRVDSKFVFHDVWLNAILEEIRDDNSILEIDNQRVFRYDSLYLDTKDYCMYKQHHNGKPRRVKLRYRTYCDTGDIFFEIKQRQNPMRTHKFREKVSAIPPSLGEIELSLLQKSGICFNSELEHKLVVGYKRITLVANDCIERVTLDTFLSFHNFKQYKVHPHLIIAEIKQERFSRISPFIHALRRRNIKEQSISKYALGLIELSTDIKSNAFKSKVRTVEHIENRCDNGYK